VGTANGPPSTADILRQNLPVLRTLGVAVALASALRTSRHAVIPLWGIYLGLDAPTISIIFGLSALVDVVLFYPGGKIMDTLGRRWVAVPSTLLLGVAHALLPLTHGAWTLTAVALFMGLALGTMSGMGMTLGVDVAPLSGRPQFLGMWRLLSDLGEGAGPLVLSVLIAVLSPTASVLSVGALGLVTSYCMNRWIPRRADPGGHHSGSPQEYSHPALP
jgi:MFS family permease